MIISPVEFRLTSPTLMPFADCTIASYCIIVPTAILAHIVRVLNFLLKCQPDGIAMRSDTFFQSLLAWIEKTGRYRTAWEFAD